MRALILCLLLAGCATRPTPAPVPVAVGCVGAVPARPLNTFGAGAYPGDKAAAQAALIDGAAWEGYALQLEVIIAGCPTQARVGAKAQLAPAPQPPPARR